MNSQRIVPLNESPQEVQDAVAKMGVNPSKVRVIEVGSVKELEALFGDKGSAKFASPPGEDGEYIPYNGVEGDSCDCQPCNLRRKEMGASPGIDGDRDAEDKTIEDILRAIVGKGNEPKVKDEVSGKRLSLEEFQQLPSEERTKALDSMLEDIQEGLRHRAEQVTECLKDTADNLEKIGEIMRRTAGEKNSMPARLELTLLISNVKRGIDYINGVKDQASRRQSKSNTELADFLKDILKG